ncbi:NADH-quinone oxidoreductase subunit J, partial [Mesorhizobium sp. M8A.F.Ca.ET.207.01.1.1]|uniref:NADH-quinone oxidoreductase subunit J n=1 Tax=Mesorhizobium sp. M8A.F.Ca.ET.207.01.1.1 TaxID=2563968 RepID=UPI001AEE257A
MDWVNIAFWVFAIAATVSAGAVISVRNPVHAVLCLVLTFFSIACVWLLVGAEFLGVAVEPSFGSGAACSAAPGPARALGT